jgi:hypothetical protein
MMCFFQHFICNVWILCHIIFFLFHFLLFVMFVMFGYILKKKKKLGSGVNCEEEMRKKNEMGEWGCV